ncbi:hypothetical protein J4464_02375 [Candidatus Woesearchaeota archaeon]|nr:hypothetical protein [Candidatus Woesearchaeota archaeon]
MRVEYLLYPETLAKLNESGIEERVRQLKESDEGLHFIGGFVYGTEIFNAVQDLKARGFYKGVPEDFRKTYFTTLNAMVRKPEEFKWTVQRPTGALTEPCDLEDMLLFTGELASLVLSPEELWDFAKFGFPSASAFITSVGAFILRESRDVKSTHEGYTWTRKGEDGSEIITEVTGDMNADLRVFQTDIAPYPTLDPFGNAIGMRPEMDADKHFVAAYHSNEGTLLSAVMKYIEQLGIKVDFYEDKAKKLIAWGRSLGQGGGSCAEHFGGCDQDARMFFFGFIHPIPVLNDANATDQHSPCWLTTTEQGAYGVYIAHNGDLVVSYQNSKTIKKPEKIINARFPPDDAHHLVKGLIYQSAKGLGRTSAKQLLDILAYRFSPQFEEDQARYIKP